MEQEVSQPKKLKLENDEKAVNVNNVNCVEEDSSTDENKSTDLCPFYTLPPEMLTKILSKLDTCDLYQCRQVNWTWNETASRLLQHRAEFQVRFNFDHPFSDYDSSSDDDNDRDDKVKVKKMDELNFNHYPLINTKKEIKTLVDFNELFSSSTSTVTPFASFCFYQIPSLDNRRDWSNFISIFGLQIKKLMLDFYIQNEEEFRQMTLDLKTILLVDAPNISEFGVTLYGPDFDVEKATFPSSIHLFSEDHLNLYQRQGRLSRLKKLHIDYSYRDWCPRVVGDILKCTPNLERIEYDSIDDDDEDSLQNCDLTFLHSHGVSLKTLETSKVKISPTLSFCSAFTPISTFDLKLTHLTLEMEGVESTVGSLTLISTFMSQLFESIKDQVRTMNLQAFGFLPKVKIPVFSALEELTFSGSSEQFFPDHLKDLELFPLVTTLDFGCFCETLSSLFPHEHCTPVFPRVREFIMEEDVDADCIKRIGLLCPNLRTLKHIRAASCNNIISDWSSTGQAIWDNLSNLEVLHVIIDVKSSYNHDFEVDSTFTGMYPEDCQRLYDLWTKAGKVELDQASLEEVERLRGNHLSILDLPNLKELHILLEYDWCYDHMDPYDHEQDSDELFKSTVTIVSQLAAFSLMPGLKVNLDTSYYFNDDD